MKIVIAPDSFKESLTAEQAAHAMAAGVRRVLPDAEIALVPMADGGEGTAATIARAQGGRMVRVPVRDALGRPSQAEFALVRGLAIIEVATAVGLAQLDPEDRLPLRATTVGVADLVLAALDHGATRLLIGLGGTATNDGGAGLLAGLGARLIYPQAQINDDRPPTPEDLSQLVAVELDGLDSRLGSVEMELACDVTNVLLGPEGASRVFGPQKGASPVDVEVLEAAMGHWADVLEAGAHVRVRDIPGAGAAGGLGAAFFALGAVRRAGVEIVAEEVGLAAALAGADLVLTGEGSIDSQTLGGKTPHGVAQLAKVQVPAVRVCAFGGRVELGPKEGGAVGLDQVVCITPSGIPLAQALERAAENLASAVATTLASAVATTLTQ
ncbi:glycerate kinase [Timonella senegalensis]|uniref:glycerate kinase n=1 Tax=Timonella senegalensis TaxID=1465825 RepID=UPI002FDF3161